MKRFIFSGEVIATKETKNGKKLITVWDYEYYTLPITGFYFGEEAIEPHKVCKFEVLVGEKYTSLNLCK